jgi:hypothetical protein
MKYKRVKVYGLTRTEDYTENGKLWVTQEPEEAYDKAEANPGWSVFEHEAWVEE